MEEKIEQNTIKIDEKWKERFAKINIDLNKLVNSLGKLEITYLNERSLLLQQYNKILEEERKFFNDFNQEFGAGEINIEKWIFKPAEKEEEKK